MTAEFSASGAGYLQCMAMGKGDPTAALAFARGQPHWTNREQIGRAPTIVLYPELLSSLEGVRMGVASSAVPYERYSVDVWCNSGRLSVIFRGRATFLHTLFLSSRWRHAQHSRLRTRLRTWHLR